MSFEVVLTDSFLKDLKKLKDKIIRRPSFREIKRT